MSQTETEIADLFRILVDKYHESSKFDEKIASLLRDKVKELGNEELIAELSKFGFEIIEGEVQGDTSGEKVKSKTDSDKKMKKKKIAGKVALTTIGTVFASSLPGNDFNMTRAENVDKKADDKESKNKRKKVVY